MTAVSSPIVPLERWEPDRNIVAAVLSTPKAARKMTDLSGPDRSWLVAGLTLAGMTAHCIAERLSCSLRLVRTIRAEEMTQVCFLAQQREAALADEVRQSELARRLMRRELEAAKKAAVRMRQQLDQIVDAHLAGDLAVFPRCRHPKIGYNVYRSAGREYCRTCRTEWDRKHRKNSKSAASVHR